MSDIQIDAAAAPADGAEQIPPLVTSVKIEGELYAVFKDRLGVEHHAPPLTGADRRDLVNAMGPIMEWNKYLSSVNTQDFVIWCSLRKEGRNRKQIRERDWVLTVDDVADLFAALSVAGMTLEARVMKEILANSGLRFGKASPVSDPPGPAATTGSAN